METSLETSNKTVSSISLFLYPFGIERCFSWDAWKVKIDIKSSLFCQEDWKWETPADMVDSAIQAPLALPWQGQCYWRLAAFRLPSRITDNASDITHTFQETSEREKTNPWTLSLKTPCGESLPSFPTWAHLSSRCNQDSMKSDPTLLCLAGLVRKNLQSRLNSFPPQDIPTPRERGWRKHMMSNCQHPHPQQWI